MNALRHLYRRLQRELLATRVAQLRMAAAHVRCTTAAERLYQARLLGMAAVARCELYALELRS